MGGVVPVPTLLAGVWGMNFAHMQELGWRLGYPAALGSMMLTTGCFCYRLKRAGWLRRGKSPTDARVVVSSGVRPFTHQEPLVEKEIDELTIRFPARAGYLTVARLNAAALGAVAGFDVEELDDLRLAMNEAVTWLLADEEAGGQVELVLSAQQGTVAIAGVRSGRGLPSRRLDDLVEAILGATVDDYELKADEGSDRRIRLMKAKASADAD